MKAIFALIVLGLLIAPSSITSQAVEAPIVPEIDQIHAYIAKYSMEYGINPYQLKKTIQCESQFNPRAINYHDGGKGKHSVGILQFQRTTFDGYSKKMGEKLDYYSYHDQIKVASYMWSNGQQRQWTCARNLGLV